MDIGVWPVEVTVKRHSLRDLLEMLSKFEYKLDTSSCPDTAWFSKLRGRSSSEWAIDGRVV